MDRKTACQILGVMPDISDEKLKTEYRKLISLTHPDSNNDHDYPYDAYEINEAYGYLISHPLLKTSKDKAKERKAIKWSAPVNPNAYCDREIYQYYEDVDGSILGFVTIDTGKYTWIPDEDFSLFLKSLHKAAKSIISDDDAKKGLNRTDDINLMADIAYLLSGQFCSSETVLGLMKHEDDSCFTKAYLEINAFTKIPKEGDYLLPKKVKDHRLYVCDITGNELGYISFFDDRLLFGIVPLFERKCVQVKMTVDSIPAKKKAPLVNLWLKLLPEETSNIDSIEVRINALLNE